MAKYLAFSQLVFRRGSAGGLSAFAISAFSADSPPQNLPQNRPKFPLKFAPKIGLLESPKSPEILALGSALSLSACFIGSVGVQLRRVELHKNAESVQKLPLTIISNCAVL